MGIKKYKVELCNGCGVCVEDCLMGVFEMDKDTGKARVAHPEDCVECNLYLCEAECPTKAIEITPKAIKKMWTPYIIGTIIALFIFFLPLSCAQSREVKGTLIPTAAPQAAKAQSDWEIEWQSTIQKAKKEGRVVVTANIIPYTRKSLGEAFEKKFGIVVEWVPGRGPEIVMKVLQERRSGIYSYDLFISGFTTVQSSLKPAGAVLPLEPLLLLPEVKDPKYWFQNRLPWADRDKTAFIFWLTPSRNITINTNQVKKDEIKSYYDLLDSKWKGKIVMDDPTVTGSANNWAVTIGNYFPSLGWDFQRGLAKQEPLLTRDRRLLAEWVAHGKYPITLPISGFVVEDMKREGAPLDFVIPKEGVYGSSGNGHVAYYNNAPHPSAARVFANWLLTREPQEIAAVAEGYESTRLDVSNSHLPIEWTRAEVLKATGTLVRPDPETLAKIGVESKPTIMEIWGPLVK